MENKAELGKYALGKLSQLGADKAKVSVSSEESDEFNVEAGEFTLIRSLFTSSMSMMVIKDRKKGSISLNTLTKEEIDRAAEECMESALSGAEDDCYTIAEKEENFTWAEGSLEPDKEKFLDSLILFTEDVKKEYPAIMLEQVVASYSRIESVCLNSNGVDFRRTIGFYVISVMYSAHDGDRTTSFNSFEFEYPDPATRIIDMFNVRTLFDRCIKELDTVPFSGKFDGVCLFSPECGGGFAEIITDNFCGDYALIEKTSPWREKLGQKVADESFTLRIIPRDERIFLGERVTGDGYLSKNYDVIKNGVLENFCIGEYASLKTGFKRSPSTSGAIEILPGKKSVEEIIAGIEKGIFVCRFSGGEPSANGDFSGVAKNSFLIENGKITVPVSETMISGNFADMLNSIEGISSEVYMDGSCCLPYVAFGGVTVSGK